MTRSSIEEIVKRYREIEKAMKLGKNRAKFYAGGRKYSIPITDEVWIIFGIIEEIGEREEAKYMTEIIKKLKKGYSDKRIINESPVSRNAYYERKRKYMGKIYECCIGKGLVSYDEIMEEQISKELKEIYERTKERNDENIELSDGKAYRALRGIEMDKVE